MRGKILFTATFALVALAACGGGGGGSSSAGTPLTPTGPTTTPTPSPYATIAPASSRQGDVRTLAVGGGASEVGYWPDYNVALVAGGPVLVNAMDGTIIATAADNNSIVAFAYSAGTHSIVFATATSVYLKAPTGPVLTEAVNLHSIESLAVSGDGTIYAIDTDHVVKIAGGISTNVTAPGSIGPRYWNATPSIAFASDGTMLVSDPTNDAVSRITTSGVITPFAGSCKVGMGASGAGGSCWRAPEPGTGTAANFGAPGALAYDASSGTLYVADSQGNQLWAVASNGAAQAVAGYGAPFNADGNGLAAFLNMPTSIAFQPSSRSVDILENAPNGQQAVVAFSTIGTAAPASSPAAVAVYVPQGLEIDALAATPDGGAWTADSNARSIDRISPTGSITKFPTTTAISPTWDIATDAAGNAWFLATHTGAMNMPIDQGVLEIAPSGTQTYVAAAPQHPGADARFIQMEAIAVGPDGNAWFTESENSLNGGSFGTINATSHAVTQYATSIPPGYIASGPGGTIAYGMTVTGKPGIVLASLSSGQTTASYTVNLSSALSLQYRSSDSTLWFSDGNANIGSLSSTGVEHDYPVCGECDPINLTVAPDGSVWSDEGNYPGDIIRVTPSGQVMHYLLPISLGPTYGISARSDGKLWVYNNSGVLFLYDPAAYDAMNGPHPTQSVARHSTSSVRSRWHAKS